MTRWFVDDDIAEKATSTSYRILETEVEVVPENVPAACTDENVNIKEELHSENSIGCDSSLQWFHLRCIYSKEPPKSRKWFCRECYIQCLLPHNWPQITITQCIVLS